MTERRGHPEEIRKDMGAACRLMKWHVFFTVTIVTVMAAAMGSSQAMKTAWVEDLLAFIPPLVFLAAERYERRGSEQRYPYGFDRANGLGFMIAAVTLAAVGLFLLKDSLMALWAREHVTVGTMRIMGRDIWLGWIMIAAQAYAIIPPLIIGHREMPLAKRLRDKLLHADALMNKANWQTGVAGILGIVGLGLGYWWADPVAAALISLSIIWDGWGAIKIATAELVDGAPRELGEDELSPEGEKIVEALKREFPLASIKLRETGRFIRAEVMGARPGPDFDVESFPVPGLDDRWRLDSIAFRP